MKNMTLVNYEIKGENSKNNDVEIIHTNIIEAPADKFKMPEKIIIEAKINGVTNLFLNGFYHGSVNFDGKITSDCYYFTVEGVVYYFRPVVQFNINWII